MDPVKYSTPTATSQSDQEKNENQDIEKRLKTLREKLKDLDWEANSFLTETWILTKQYLELRTKYYNLIYSPIALRWPANNSPFRQDQAP